MTLIIAKFENAKAGVMSEVGFYAGNKLQPYSVILRDTDADATVGSAIRFADEGAAIAFAKSIITDGPVPAGTFVTL